MRDRRLVPRIIKVGDKSGTPWDGRKGQRKDGKMKARGEKEQRRYTKDGRQDGARERSGRKTTE